MYTNPQECSPRRRNANAQDGSVGAAAKCKDVFKRVRFYCPFFSIIFLLPDHKNVISVPPPALLLPFGTLSPVCFIRTSGPRIFNQSAAEGFFSSLISLILVPECERLLLFPRISHFCAVHISLHKEIPRLLSADASELCRRCNMTLNWISVCLTCRLTDWLTAECLQSRPLYVPALAALWGMGMNIARVSGSAAQSGAAPFRESKRWQFSTRWFDITQDSPIPTSASFGHDAARKIEEMKFHMVGLLCFLRILCLIKIYEGAFLG